MCVTIVKEVVYYEPKRMGEEEEEKLHKHTSAQQYIRTQAYLNTTVHTGEEEEEKLHKQT